MKSLNLTEVPNFCTHEHWGLTAIQGWENDLIRGALPKREIGLADFINMFIHDEWIIRHWSVIEPESVYGRPSEEDDQQTGRIELDGNRGEDVLKAWRQIRVKYETRGEFQCLRRGMLLLYGEDLAEDDPEVWNRVDASIRAAYKDLYGWTAEAMKRANLSGVIFPPNPEWYASDATTDSAKAQRAFTDTVMRLGVFCSFLPNKDPLSDKYDFRIAKPVPNWWEPDGPYPLASRWRKGMVDIAGVIPSCPKSWRAFIGKFFELAEAGGCRGIKDMVAKIRDLDYRERRDDDVAWGGVESTEDITVFQDWVLNECCKHAHDRGWTYQIHVGTDRFEESSPLPLHRLAQRYPKMKIAMLHCWPFLSEAGYLARHQSNIYIDTCWMPLLNPGFLRRSMEEWMQYVPMHKIMCGHDAHSIEAAAGSAQFTRQILGKALAKHGAENNIPEERLMAIGANLLHNNAVDVYGVGQRI